VVYTCVEERALSESRFARINVGGDTNIPGKPKVRCHDFVLLNK
jgi:hypothetical protein